MSKRLALVVTVLTGLLTVLRRTRARQAEQDLWAEATKPLDLR